MCGRWQLSSGEIFVIRVWTSFWWLFQNANACNVPYGQFDCLGRMPAVEQLLLTLCVGESTAATGQQRSQLVFRDLFLLVALQGLLMPDGPDLRCRLRRLDNSEFGEAWLSFLALTFRQAALTGNLLFSWSRSPTWGFS